MFIVFMAVIWGMALFHRREHVRLAPELYPLQKSLASEHPDAETIRAGLQGKDWRMTGLDKTKLSLRRAFAVKNREDALRYTVPVALLCVILIYIQNWWLAGLYFAALLLKWFASVTVVDLDPLAARYQVKLFGLPLFGEALTEVKK